MTVTCGIKTYTTAGSGILRTFNINIFFQRERLQTDPPLLQIDPLMLPTDPPYMASIIDSNRPIHYQYSTVNLGYNNFVCNNILVVAI